MRWNQGSVILLRVKLKAMFGSHKMRERKFGGKVEGKKKLKK